jgi:hypothetical protein
MRHASRMMQIACIVILSLIGWSTQPGHAAPSADAFSEVYRLPDGTFAVICSENSRHEPGTAAIHCDHCMLAGPVALPLPVSNGWILEPRWDIAGPSLPRQPPCDTLAVDRATSRGPPSHV